MRKFNITKVLFLLLVLPLTVRAAAPMWQMIPEKSSITFTATQNNSPVSGQFKSFISDINFDPLRLDSSYVKIVVDISSVTTSYGQVAETLKTPDWFDVKLFPSAIFTTSSITKMNEKTYQAKGNLTIRDKTIPLAFNFTLEDFTKKTSRVIGSTVIKRTSFGVGKGDWSNTNEIKDDVTVNFTITAIKK